MSWKKFAGGSALALILSAAVVVPVGAAEHEHRAHGAAVQSAWTNLETLWLIARNWWLGGPQSAISAMNGQLPIAPLPDEEPPPEGEDGSGAQARGGGSCPQGGGGGGGTDGSGSTDPNGG